MKFNCARCASLAIMLAALTTKAWCQDTGLPSLFPLPPLPPIGNGYSISQAAATDTIWGPNELSPVQTGSIQSPAPVQGPVQGPLQVPKESQISPDYLGAMKGGYDSCSSTIGSPCGGACCSSNHYVYANALLMNQVKPGGFVPSYDDVNGGQRINFCAQEFGRLWVGGFEVGTGWCFGCCDCCGGAPSNALELVYWGVFPAGHYERAFNNVSSTINFQDLDYNGASANVPFTDSVVHQVYYDYGFNSVEFNLVGNCFGGGPFGCPGHCGCCMGSGSRWGWGYSAGFRYINFNEQWLFSADPVDAQIDGNPEELNYAVSMQNNLFGFQMGTGLSYCLTNRLQAYSIAKVGVYNNHVTQLQKVYGTAGIATVNNGPFDTHPFEVRSERDALSMSAQFDFGGRWAITDNWSANFGYRVLGLAGVATIDTNVRNGQFHDIDGLGVMSRTGTFLLHGAFAGVSYCW